MAKPTRQLQKAGEAHAPQARVPKGMEALAERVEQEIQALPRAEQAAAREAATQFFKRRPRFKMKAQIDEEGQFRLSPGPSGDVVHSFRLRDTFGTTSSDFSSDMVAQLLNAISSPGQPYPDQGVMNSALAAVYAVRPADEIEAMLAVQMAATHVTAMRMLTRVT